MAEVVWLGLHGRPGKRMAMRNGRPVEMDTLVYEPAWMVGVVRPDSRRRRNAAEGLELFRQAPVEKRAPGRIRLWKLKYQGFRPVMIYPCRDADGGLVLDFAAHEWMVRHFYTELTDRVLHESDDERGLEERLGQIQKMIAGDARSVWQYIWRGRRSVLLN